MAVNLNLDEIVNRKTDTKKKSSSSNNMVRQSSDKIKKTERINLPIYEQDDKLLVAFKNLINEQNISIQDMENSGEFRETEAYNIIYNLKRDYSETINKTNGKVKINSPQFSWTRAEKMLNYLGFDVEFVFTKIEK